MNLNPKEEFDRWVELLKKTGNEDMLNDPYNIWLEAWSVAVWSLACVQLSKKTPTEVGENTSST